MSNLFGVNGNDVFNETVFSFHFSLGCCTRDNSTEYVVVK
jgi:hypothetical protein